MATMRREVKFGGKQERSSITMSQIKLEKWVPLQRVARDMLEVGKLRGGKESVEAMKLPEINFTALHAATPTACCLKEDGE